MKVLKNYVGVIEGKKFKTANDKINQTERNELKRDLLNCLKEDFEKNGFQATLTNDGVVLTIESERDTLFIAIDPVVKNLDYDLDFEKSEYDLKIAKQLEREAIRKKRAEQRAKKE